MSDEPRHKITVGAAFKALMDSDPATKAAWEATREVETSPEGRKVVQDLIAALIANKQAFEERLKAEGLPVPRTIEDWEDLALVVGIDPDRIGSLTLGEISRYVRIWLTREKLRRKIARDDAAPARQQAASETWAANDNSQAVRRKRSTVRGEAAMKMRAALTTHHECANGACGNLAPIGNNELARLAGVCKASASQFFKRLFGGHRRYRILCQNDPQELVRVLNRLNDECSAEIMHAGYTSPSGESSCRTASFLVASH